jgi:hypothetical protein
MTLQQAQLLISFLLPLGRGEAEPEFPTFGICNNLYYFLGGKGLRVAERGIIGYEFLSLCEGWEHHSGHRLFPIPLPTNQNDYWQTHYRWKGSQLYYRRELCLYVADKLFNNYIFKPQPEEAS